MRAAMMSRVNEESDLRDHLISDHMLDGSSDILRSPKRMEEFHAAEHAEATGPYVKAHPEGSRQVTNPNWLARQNRKNR